MPLGSHRMMTKIAHLVRLVFFLLVMADASVFNSNKTRGGKKKKASLPDLFFFFARMAAVLSSQMRCASPPSGGEQICQTKMQSHTHTHTRTQSDSGTFYVVFATQLWKIVFTQDLFLDDFQK